VSLFNLIATDVGRPLTDLTNQLRYQTLAADAQNVLDTLASAEREVGEHGGSWYLARLRTYRTVDDRIAGVVLTFVDITERKRAQEALLSADARFRAIVNQATVGVVQIDRNGRFTFVNGRICQLLSCAEAELLGSEVAQLIHPDELPLYLERMARLLQLREPFEIEVRLLRPDSNEVWVHNSVACLPDVQGEVQATIAVCVDITERKRAEAALRNSEEHLRMVIENAREYAIFSTDADRTITAWNTGAQRILGYSEKEAIGRSGDMIFTADDRASGAPLAEASQALAEGRAGDDRWHVRKDGSRLWASGVLMAMHDAGGRHAGFVKILRDQTEARHTQQALEQALLDNENARAALEAVNVAKDQFLAVLSHELRTPLTPAVMALQLLSRRQDIPADAQEALKLIHRNIRIESHLIDDLLDLTRISRGTLEVTRESVDLHEVIRSAVEICASDLQAKQQSLDLALDAPAPVVMGDARRLQQVVWNLLKNASKFTPAKGHIRIGTSVHEGRFRMDVADNGVGIDSEALPRIFEAFIQGGAWVAREFGGLGLGLSISKATVEAHGGRLWASSPGRSLGATFTLELPLAAM
jgi:two-component system CheB/CheR fusion protein